MIRIIKFTAVLILLAVSFSIQSEEQYEFSTESPIYVVGDVHGAYAEIRGMLEKVGVIDNDGNWRVGKAHYVSLGDLIDRGPGSRKVMDLYMKLQQQAEAAGGRFHVVLGNHEVMNLVGDLRYVAVEEYTEFAADESEEVRQQKYQSYIQRQRLVGSPANRKTFNKKFPKGFFAHRAAWSEEGQYGNWILSLPFVIKINDQVFAHAGLSKSIIGKSLKQLNQELKHSLIGYLEAKQYLIAKQALFFEDSFKSSIAKVRSMRNNEQTKRFLKFRQSLLFSKNSPTWYRGNAVCHPYFENDILANNLKQWGSKRLWVGHTVSVNRKVFKRLNEQLMLIDTGMLKSHYQGEPWIAKIVGTEVSLTSGVDGSIATPLQAPAREDANPYGMTDAEVEEFLRSAEIVEKQTTREGRTKPFKVTLQKGNKKIKALFKYKDSSGAGGRGRMKQRGKPDSYKHEIAAYQLDRMLGIGLTPVTVNRTISGKRGSLQLWIDNLVSDLIINEKRIGYQGYCDQREQVNLMNSFDYLIMNSDRNQSNIMYGQSDGQIWFIDHSKSFSNSTKRPKILRQEDIKVTASFSRALQQLTPEKLAELSPWLSQKQINAIWKRRNLMLSNDF